MTAAVCTAAVLVAALALGVAAYRRSRPPRDQGRARDL